MQKTAVFTQGLFYCADIDKKERVMHNNLFNLLQTAVQKSLPILFGFLDDLLLLGMTKIGITLPWLQWFSIFLLSATILYWSFCIMRFLRQRYRIN